MRSICLVGGWCSDRLVCGLFNRQLYNSPSFAYYVVASRLTLRTHLERQLIPINTDNHDISEDKRTIAIFGGYWRDDVGSGVFIRHLNVDWTLSVDFVASRSIVRVLHCFYSHSHGHSRYQ